MEQMTLGNSSHLRDKSNAGYTNGHYKGFLMVDSSNFLSMRHTPCGVHRSTMDPFTRYLRARSQDNVISHYDER